MTQIVDKVNAERKPQVLEESVRILKQRLKTDIHKVVMLTLTLVESLVKNCQLHFHPYLAANKCTLPIASADRKTTRSPFTRPPFAMSVGPKLCVVIRTSPTALPQRRAAFVCVCLRSSTHAPICVGST